MEKTERRLVPSLFRMRATPGPKLILTAPISFTAKAIKSPVFGHCKIDRHFLQVPEHLHAKEALHITSIAHNEVTPDISRSKYAQGSQDNQAYVIENLSFVNYGALRRSIIVLRYLGDKVAI